MAKRKPPGEKPRAKSDVPTAADLEWAKANNPSNVHDLVKRMDAAAAKASLQEQREKSSRGGAGS
jgi:hypothetical protein